MAVYSLNGKLLKAATGPEKIEVKIHTRTEFLFLKIFLFSGSFLWLLYCVLLCRVW